MEYLLRMWYMMTSCLIVVKVTGFPNFQTCSSVRSELKDWIETLNYRTGSITDTGPSLCHAMCKCTNTVADCSGNYGNLTFVPALPINITILIFSRNNLTSIHNDNFFSNVTNITGLDLSYNGLTFVCNGTFRPLTRLTTLILDFNNITSDILHLVLSINTLVNLSLMSTSLNSRALDVFSQHPLQFLQNLNAYNNTLKTINFTIFAEYINLRSICLGSCDIFDVIPDQMPSLQYLYLSDNGISHFPETCRNGTSLFPKLLVLDLESNRMRDIYNVCLPNLTQLHLSYNRFVSIKCSTFNEVRFPHLIYLSMKGTIESTEQVRFENGAFSSRSLQVIDISRSRIVFRRENLFNSGAFANCTSLKELVLFDNILSGVSDAHFDKLFGHLTALKILNLAYCEIVSISANIFKGLSLLQEIYLFGNALSVIPDGTFDSIINLTIIELDANEIVLIRETTFNPVTRRKLRLLSVANNPFICSCELKWFQQWFVSEKELFNKTRHYMCSNLPNTSLAAFYLPDQACLLSSDAFTLTVVSVSLVLITLTVTAVFYRLRWHIRLFLYEAFRGRTGYRKHYLTTGNFPYDVFVSFAVEDLDWVCEHLMPELEEQMGLRLCIHQRDFLVGENIVDNIIDSLEKSKKVMMVFSTHFARSQWCQFELALCLQHVMDHDDILVIVCLENLPNRVLTGTMMAVLKVTTYIQWEDDADARASFWSRLKIALNEILS